MRYLKKIVFYLLIFILVVNCIFCQTKGVFYEISSDDSRVYALGSIHLGTADLYPLDPIIEKAFEKSEVLAVELDITDPKNVFKAQAYILKKGLYKKGDSIENHADPELVKDLKEVLGEENFEKVKFYKPWVLLFQISSSLAYNTLDVKYGVDFYFINKAKESDKKIVALETIEEQLDAFSEIPEEDQLKILKSNLEELKDLKDKKIEEYYSELLNAYKDGDKKRLEELLLGDLKKEGYDVFYQYVYIKRNFRFVEGIKRLMKDYKSIFVVIGAGHLIGEENVVKLLQN